MHTGARSTVHQGINSPPPPPPSPQISLVHKYSHANYKTDRGGNENVRQTSVFMRPEEFVLRHTCQIETARNQCMPNSKCHNEIFTPLKEQYYLCNFSSGVIRICVSGRYVYASIILWVVFELVSHYFIPEHTRFTRFLISWNVRSTHIAMWAEFITLIPW